MVVPRQLVSLGGCSPASPNCPPRVRKQRSFGFSASLSLQVFTMRSPCRVESVSVLDRNENSYYTFLVFSRSFRNEVTLTGRVFLRSRSERKLFEHVPYSLVPSLLDGVTHLRSCCVFLRTQSERRLLPSIHPSLLRDGVTLWVECGFHITLSKRSLLWIAGRYSFRMGSPFSGQILPI